jgi:hypothetical protein
MFLLAAGSLHAQGSDDCASAQPISGLGQFAFDNVGATTDGPAACQSMSDVWFLWTAPDTGQFIFTTCDHTNIDTYIAIYDGPSCPPGTELGCNDDACGRQSTINFDAFAGSTYLLRVGGFNTWQGSGTFEMSQVPNGGSNDCVNAVPITGTGFFPWNNAGLTEDGTSECVNIYKDLWYAWTAPTTDYYTFSLCGKTTLNSVLVLYEGTSCPPSVVLGCSDDDCATQSEITTVVSAGLTYLIRLGAANAGETGSGLLGIHDDACSPLANDDLLEENDDCASAVNVNDGTTPDLWCSKADPDWYIVAVPPLGTVDFDVLFTHSSGDIDIALYSDDCQDLLATSTSADDDEEIVWNNPSGFVARFRLAVYVFASSSSDCNSYDLVVTGPGGGIGSKYCTATVNSTGAPADMFAAGSNSASAGDLVMRASPVPNRPGIFFHGADQAQVPFGNGFLCATNDLVRGRVLYPTTNIAIYAYDNSDNRHSMLQFVGKRRNFQYWFRDPSAGGAFFNLSNAITLLIFP